MEFKTYHCAIHDQTEDQGKLPQEQVILDNHEHKVEELMKRLVDLVAMTKPMMPHMSGKGNY